MRTESIVICGAGGHAKVVYDAIVSSAMFDLIELRDDSFERIGKTFLDSRIVGPIHSWNGNGRNVHVAIGDSSCRQDMLEKLVREGAFATTIVHPTASVSRFSEIKAGVFVAALARIGPNAMLGQGAIANHGCVVDHDCVVGEYVHVAPGAVLGGGVIVGNCSLVGAGCVVLPGLSVGKHCVIGAGAVVTRDVGNNERVVGVPARLRGHTCYRMS